MAYTIPEIEPLTITCGDRLQWKRTDIEDFPADEWTLTYYLRGNTAGAQIDIAATADGDDFSIDVSTDTSAAYTPGVYYWSAFVSKSGDRKLVGQGRIEIKENPSEIVLPVDKRSHARRVLEALEATIEGRATTDHQRYVFQAVGRSVDRMPIKDLLEFRDYYANLVEIEDQSESIERGESRGGNIYMKFT